MAKGLQAYGKKEKRAMRRRNHIALDLADAKYAQRVVRKREKIKPSVKEWDDDDSGI